MKTHTEKTQHNKSLSAANAVAKKHDIIPLQDKRPAAMAQMKLQEIANNSFKINQLRSFQKTANNSPKTTRTAQLQVMANQYSMHQQPLVQRKGTDTGNPVVQRVVSVSGLQYIPTPADLVFINALDAQIPAAELAASNDVQNAPPPPLHSNHQAAYMMNPTAALWGNCVEEKLNVWAGGNGWNMQNNSNGSNPDYSRMRAGTKIWADLTTAAEAGAGASHIIDKLNRKVNGGEYDGNWVAADVVHNSLNPLAGGPPGIVATNGVVTLAHRNGWQRYKTYKGTEDVDYDDLMERRIAQAGPLPSYATFTQAWNAPMREELRRWIDGTYDAHLPDDSSDYEMFDSEDSD